jgi:TPR repeat protein
MRTLRAIFRALEEKFPILYMGIWCLVFLVVAGVVSLILDYIAGQLNGGTLAFLLLLAFLGGFSAHEVWLRTDSGRSYYEPMWKEHDKVIKKSGKEAPSKGNSLVQSQDQIEMERLKKSAAQGDAGAQFNIGALYSKGKDIPQDYKMARQWWEKAAAQGHAHAQWALGMLYYWGHDVPQDYVQAREWYEKAAAQGNVQAQLNLGDLYRRGHGVPQDYVQEREWYEKAAAQGDARAQYDLGLLYADRLGAPKDYVRAYMWLSMAAAQGDKIATQERDKVVMKMTPAQIAEAQRLAQQCQAQQFKGC